MADVDSGKAYTGMDKPTHVPGTNKGGSLGSYESQSGHNSDGTSTAERSTGVDPKSSGPIDPRMPNLSPA